MNNSSTRPDSQPISTTDMNTVQYWFEHIPIITNTYQSLYNKDQSSLNIFDILYSKIYSNTAVLQAIPLDVLLNIGIYIFKVFINRHELKAIDDLCVPFSILIGFFPSFYFLYTYSQYSLSGYESSLLSFTNQHFLQNAVSFTISSVCSIWLPLPNTLLLSSPNTLKLYISFPILD